VLSTRGYGKSRPALVQPSRRLWLRPRADPADLLSEGVGEVVRARSERAYPIPVLFTRDGANGARRAEHAVDDDRVRRAPALTT
jgi:hypothetical protein